MSEYLAINNVPIKLPNIDLGDIMYPDKVIVFNNFQENQGMGWCSISKNKDDGSYIASGLMHPELIEKLKTRRFVLGSTLARENGVSKILSLSVTPDKPFTPHTNVKGYYRSPQIVPDMSEAIRLIGEAGVNAQDATRALKRAFRLMPDECVKMIDAELKRRGLK